MSDVTNLAKGIGAARKYVKSPVDLNGTGQKIPVGSQAVLEKNKKTPTGWEPVVTMPGDKPSPKGSITIARSYPRNPITGREQKSRGVLKTG